MKDLTVPGLTPGVPCPSCRRGLLIVVCRKDQGNNGIYGPGSRSWSHSIIDRVACTHCSISYETSMRGVLLDQHLDEQIKTRLYPEDKRPKTKLCKEHPGIPLKEGSYDDRHDDLHTRMRHEPTHLRKYKYCQACLKVIFIGKSEDEMISERDSAEFVKNASPVLKKSIAELGKSLRNLEPKKKRRTA